MDAVTYDLNRYMDRLEFEDDKREEFFKKIAPQLNMIEAQLKLIKPVYDEYLEAWDLDFEEDLVDMILLFVREQI